MQCSNKYDIPYGPLRFDGILACSESDGIYRPFNFVPNCTGNVFNTFINTHIVFSFVGCACTYPITVFFLLNRFRKCAYVLEFRLPGHVETLGEFFYYTGSCDDDTVLDQIKNNFIKEVENLKKNGFGGVCSNSSQCNLGNVSVTCGPIFSRRRRASDSEMQNIRMKRAGSEILVEVRLSSVFQNSSTSRSDSFTIAKDIQKEMFHEVKRLSRNGKLTVNGLIPDQESFALGLSVPVCPESLSIRMHTFTCG
jgi:hypothetical protein